MRDDGEAEADPNARADADADADATEAACIDRPNKRQRTPPKKYDDMAEAELLNAIASGDKAWTKRALARVFETEKKKPESILVLLCKQRHGVVNECWRDAVVCSISHATTTDVCVGVTSLFDCLSAAFDTAPAEALTRSMIHHVLQAMVSARKGMFDPYNHGLGGGSRPVAGHEELHNMMTALCWCMRRATTVLPATECGSGAVAQRMDGVLRTALRLQQDTGWTSQCLTPSYYMPLLCRAVALHETARRHNVHNDLDSIGSCFTSKFPVAVVAAETWPVYNHNGLFHDIFLKWGYSRAQTTNGKKALIEAVVCTTLTFYDRFTATATRYFGDNNTAWLLSILKTLALKGALRVDTQAKYLIKHPLLRSGQLFFWMFLDRKRVRDLLSADVSKPSLTVTDSARVWAPLLQGIHDRRFDDPVIARAVQRTTWFHASTSIGVYRALQNAVSVEAASADQIAFYERGDYQSNVKTALDNARMILAATACPSSANIAIAPLCRRVRDVFKMLLMSARRVGSAKNVFGLLPVDVLVKMIFPLACQEVNAVRADLFKSLSVKQKYAFTDQSDQARVRLTLRGVT
tara:strand:+ start:219 stop:1955 length:1737 start_codon:yes stop_codon:yes gene_type:complete